MGEKTAGVGHFQIPTAPRALRRLLKAVVRIRWALRLFWKRAFRAFHYRHSHWCGDDADADLCLDSDIGHRQQRWAVHRAVRHQCCGCGLGPYGI
jgi:hypothetical protein